MLDVVAEKREDLTEFTRGELAARKLDRYKDVWEIVVSKGDADEEESKDLLSSQGLRVLDLLLSAWETEAEVEKAEGSWLVWCFQKLTDSLHRSTASFSLPP